MRRPTPGDIITLDTQGKSWKEVTIQPYHGLKAKVLQVSKTDLMVVKLLDIDSFKRTNPRLSAEYVYMPIWAVMKPKLMDVE